MCTIVQYIVHHDVQQHIYIYSQLKKKVCIALQHCLIQVVLKLHTSNFVLIYIPCPMEKKKINSVFNRNFILKKKFHLFVAHHCQIGNHFSVADMPCSCDDHIVAYPSHQVNQTPNIGMGIVYHSSCKAWASCRWLTVAFRLLWSRRSSS